MAQPGSPPRRPPRDYPSPDEFSSADGRGADRGPADQDAGERGTPEQGAHHRGLAERALRARRAERPQRPGWENADPFAPDADANLPAWAAPSEFRSDRPPGLPRRPGRNRAEDDARRDDGRGTRRGHRRPDDLGPDYRQSERQPGRRRAGNGGDVAEPGYPQLERAAGPGSPAYHEQASDQGAYDGQAYNSQGYSHVSKTVPSESTPRRP